MYNDDDKSPKEINPKIAVLKEQFIDTKDDSTMKRELSSLWKNDISPMIEALVEDNLDEFKKEYDKPVTQPKDALPYLNLNYLHMACACASEEVSKFLLEKLGATFTTEGYGDLLAYAMVSKNLKWIENIAQQLAEAKKAIPYEIYGCRNAAKTKRFIEEIFEHSEYKNHVTKNSRRRIK